MGAGNVYSPYGYHLPSQGGLGFNGEQADRVTGHYHLGNGYRAYNPVLMRFNCPDSLSPFTQAGLNTYGYCQGNPVNFGDPSGHLLERLAGPVKQLLTRAPAVSLRNAVKTSGNTALASDAGEATKKYTVFLGWHGGERASRKSLHEGLKSGFSKPGRQLQGKAFYITDDLYQAQAYAKAADGPGEVYGVYLQGGISLVPGIGYAKDIAGRIAIYPLVYNLIKVGDLPSPPLNAVQLRQAPSSWTKKRAPGT